MPMKPMAYCSANGCSVRVAHGRCPQHRTLTSNQGRGSAAERGYDAAWARFSKARLQRLPVCGMRTDGTLDAVNSRCVQLGLTTAATCTDHVVPLRHGGAKYHEDNLRSLCDQCNGWKARTIERQPGKPLAASKQEVFQTVSGGRFLRGQKLGTA